MLLSLNVYFWLSALLTKLSNFLETVIFHISNVILQYFDKKIIFLDKIDRFCTLLSIIANSWNNFPTAKPLKRNLHFLSTVNWVIKQPHVTNRTTQILIKKPTPHSLCNHYDLI